MKPITLHPLSVLAGLALAGIAFVLVGAAQAPGAVLPFPTKEVRVVGSIPADWWTFVELRSVSPTQTYTVPLDRHFVVTAARNSADILVNGNYFGSALAVMDTSFAAVSSPATRVTISPGSLVMNQFNGVTYTDAQLWGYLEPVR